MAPLSFFGLTESKNLPGDELLCYNDGGSGGDDSWVGGTFGKLLVLFEATVLSETGEGPWNSKCGVGAVVDLGKKRNVKPDASNSSSNLATCQGDLPAWGPET